MKNITAYIPCHNAEKFIRGCLESLFSQTLRPAEVIVVNDGSTDRTVEVAGEFPVRIIHLQDHPGLAAARNAAIEESGHDYIASLDADCIPERRWLENLMKVLEEEGADGAGGKLIEAHQVRIADRWRAVHMRQNWGDKRVENPPFLFGCNTLFAKSVLEDVDRYDIRLRSNGEDVDISTRLLSKGHKLVYNPAAVVRHLKKDTISSVLKADWNWGYMTSGDRVKFESNSNIVYHNYTNARYRFQQDLASGRYSLLPLDIILFFAHTYWDIGHRKMLHLPRKPQRGIRVRMKTLSGFQKHLEQLSERRFLNNPHRDRTARRGNNWPPDR